MEGDNVIYRKVIIKGKDDFPEDGEYFCNRNGFKTVQRLRNDLPEKNFQREVRWYLKEEEDLRFLLQRYEIFKEVNGFIESGRTYEDVIDEFLSKLK